MPVVSVKRLYGLKALVISHWEGVTRLSHNDSKLFNNIFIF